MDTQTLIERELKIRLADENAWADFCASLGVPDRVIRQVNTYFDTRDRRLCVAAERMVRVRETSDSLVITVKDRANVADSLLLSSRERTTPVSKAQWRSVHRGHCALTELPIPLCQDLYREVGQHLFPLGSMVNNRRVYTLSEGYIVEVDRTELPAGRVDFEVEIELRQDDHTTDAALRCLYAAVPTFAGQPDPTTKYARFLEALGSASPRTVLSFSGDQNEKAPVTFEGGASE